MIAYLLGLCGGTVDAASYLVFWHIFTAQMSGNSTTFGVAIGHLDWSKAVDFLGVIAVYALGGFAGAFIVNSADPQHPRLRPGLLTEAILLAVAALTEALHHPHVALPVTAFALGVQNATYHTAFRSGSGTTYITGDLTKAMEALATAIVKRSREPLQKMREPGGIFVSYILGALIGGLLTVQLRSFTWPVGLAVVVLLGVSALPATKSS